MILQRPIERAQMQKLLAAGKTDLLQFVSSRTRRPFSAYLVRQQDGKVGFEFEARDPSKPGARRGARGVAAALRVLGAHPKDGKPVEIFAGRYGPYVKHGDVNATVRERDRVDTLTLDEALALIAEKAGASAPARAKPAARAPRASTKAEEPKRGYVPVVKKGRSTVAAKPTAAPGGAAKTKTKTKAKTRAKVVAKPAATKTRSKGRTKK